jgi:hypothetical protein
MMNNQQNVMIAGGLKKHKQNSASYASLAVENSRNSANPRPNS